MSKRPTMVGQLAIMHLTAIARSVPAFVMCQPNQLPVTPTSLSPYWQPAATLHY
ncbi:hypothetical protein ACLK1S_14080 [Escherichia coli]